MGFKLKDIASVAGGGAGFGFLAGAQDQIGNIVGTKYASDLQGHAVDRENQYNRELANEMWNKQVLENQRVEGVNAKLADARYARERADALADWSRQNDYNSPKAQMQRFKDAGLNPALMYTQGNVGNSVAVSQARMDDVRLEPARAEYTPSARREAGRIAMEGLGNYIRLRQVGLQTKQMAVESALKVEQARALKIENDHYEKTGGYRGEGRFRREISDVWSDIKDTQYMRKMLDDIDTIKKWWNDNPPKEVEWGWRQDQSEAPVPIHVDEFEPAQ